MVMVLIFLCLLITALFPEIPLPGTKKAIEICLFSVIPTMFPFFVMNHILLKSGAITSFCNRYLGFFGKLFHLPPCSASAVVLGFLSGYPAGTKAAGELYEQKSISRDQYQRLTAFCSNAGPAFITGTVGAGMLGSPKYGIYLLSVHIISALTVGIIMSIFDKKDYPDKQALFHNLKKPNLLNLFSEGIYDSLRSVATVCGFVIFFGCITSYMLKISGIPGILLTAFTEMTNGIAVLSNSSLPTQLKIPLISAVLGWGGLCVHAQSFCFLKEKRYYITGKALQGIISLILSVATISLV